MLSLHEDKFTLWTTSHAKQQNLHKSKHLLSLPDYGKFLNFV